MFVLASGDNATVRLFGRVQPDPVTGQITAMFDNNPELPFSDFELKLFGGPGASLVNPATCGRGDDGASIEAFSGQVGLAVFVVQCGWGWSWRGVSGECAVRAEFERGHDESGGWWVQPVLVDGVA